jgi:outer membrane receptor protein involved in Fe transport
MVGAARTLASDRRTRARLAYAGLVSVWIASAYGMPAMAQPEAQAQAGAAPQDQGMEEIVVTAQKREEAIFAVPITITAYSAKFLDMNRIQRFDDLAAFVPGLEVSPQSSNDTGFSIRGITTDDGSANADTRVSIFLDGVSFSRSRGSTMEFYDLDRIEVLKGPQETLFGRGAEIGAISVITKKPIDEFDAALTAGAGNYGSWEIEGFVNVPLVDDKVLFRVAMDHVDRGGYIHNIAGEPQSQEPTPGGKGSDLMGIDHTSFRPSFRFLPSDDLTIDLSYNYERDDDEGVDFKNNIIPPTGGNTSPFTFNELDEGNQLGVRRELHSLTGTVTWDLTQALKLTSITNYRWYNAFENFDADGSLLHFLLGSELYRGRQFSQEVRVNYDDGGRFKGFAGVSAFHETGEQRVGLQTDERIAFLVLSEPILHSPYLVNGKPNILFGGTNPFTGQPLLPYFREYYSFLGGTDAYEAFTDGTYSVTDDLDITAGIRMTYEDIAGYYRSPPANPPTRLPAPAAFGTNIEFPATDGTLGTEGRFLSATGRVVADYTWSPDLKTYASYSRGRRPPTEQISQTTLQPDNLQAETVDNYEVGFKSKLFDNRASLDGAFFYYNYQNFETTELSPQTGQPVDIDAGAATDYGMELQANAHLTDNIETFGNFTWTHGRFDGTPNGASSAGQHFRLDPDFAFLVGFTLTSDEYDWGQLYLTPTYSWKSRVYFEETPNTDLISQGAFGLLNIKGGYRLPGGKIEISAYLKNALDQKYIIDAGNTGEDFGLPTFVPGAPRFYGFDVTVRW